MTLTESHAHGVEVPPVLDFTIGGVLRQAADEAPDQLALIEGIPDVDQRRQWTWSELLTEAERTARALLAQFKPGDHVAVWAHNIPEWVMLEYGCALAGMTIVTVNPAYQANELQYVVSQSNSKALFVVDEHRGNPMRSIAEQIHPDCPDLEEIVRFADWDAFLDRGDPATALPAVDPGDQVMIQYTSGTTGFPKGAALHHRGLVTNANHYFDRLGVVPGDHFVTMMPLFHTAGSAMNVLGCSSTRCTQVLVPAFEPELVLELIETYGAAGMIGVPTMLIALMEHPAFGATDLSSLKAINSGGSLVPEQLVRTLEKELGAPFTIVYGQTETSPVLNMTHPDDTIEDKALTIGPPMPCMEIRIVDPETGATLPVGETGELVTRGYQVMHGYYLMPDRTAETIDADGWLHTGDLAAMDDRGYCTIEGRLKDMIIRGGENIYPKEIEEVLFAHDAVAEVAVVGLPDETWGETVGAFVRPAAGTSVDKNELFAYLRDQLAPHKTPKQWFSVDEFPLTGSGKIQKFVLRDQWVAGEWAEL